MNRQDIEKLLGGYAAGTLTASERETLFAAALEDQELFESLAAEEPLREVLQDPAAKAQFLAALDERGEPWFRRLLAPALGVIAATAMILMAVFSRYERKTEPVVVAETRREPVKSFQLPLPVTRSPLPTKLEPKSLPLPPPLPVVTPPPVGRELDALARQAAPLPVPSALPPPAAAAAPPPSAKVAEALSAVAEEAKTAKPGQQVLQTAARPAFRALNFVASPNGAAEASRLGLQYTVFKKSASGELTPVEPQGELDPGDDVVIRFESRVPGFLSVSRLDGATAPRPLANESLQPSRPLNLSGGGARQLLVRFSRLTAAAQKAQQANGAVGGVVAPTFAPDQQQATFTITLKYK